VIPQQPAADAEPMPDGLVEAMDQELAPEPGETPALPPSEQAEKARIAQFETEQKFPQHTKEIIDEIDELRTFVNKTVMEPKVVGGVAENLILRNQYIRMGQTWAKNPDLTCQPRKLLGPPKKFKVPPPPEALMANPELQQQVEQDMLAQQDFEAYVEALSMFGQTIEILVKKGFDDAGGAQVLEGGIQDVQTDGFWWVKATWQESMGRDPIGVHRANDFQDTVARLESLAHSYEQGEFDDQDPRYSEYLDLSDTVREQVMAEEWVGKAYGEVATGETDENGQPVMEPQDPRELAWQTGERAPCSAIAEIPRLRTWRIDPIDPRDVRRDWSITRPEEWRKCRWISHRLWMTDADLMDEFGVTKEGLADCAASTPAQTLGDPRAPGAQAQPMTTEDPADRSDVEQPARNGQRAVWERWDRSANRRYVWIEGGSKFLVNEVPIVVSKGWYPFFLLWFNRVTGRFEPISDAKLQRPLNEEYNLLRTHDRQARRAAYNKYIIAKNLLSEEEKAKLESCPPEGVIECKRANEVRKYLQVVVGSNYQPLLYDTTKVRQGARRDLEHPELGARQHRDDEVRDLRHDRQRGDERAERPLPRADRVVLPGALRAHGRHHRPGDAGGEREGAGGPRRGVADDGPRDAVDEPQPDDRGRLDRQARPAAQARPLRVDGRHPEQPRRRRPRRPLRHQRADGDEGPARHDGHSRRAGALHRRAPAHAAGARRRPTLRSSRRSLP
jgi:hypothetical protein